MVDSSSRWFSLAVVSILMATPALASTTLRPAPQKDSQDSVQETGDVNKDRAAVEAILDNYIEALGGEMSLDGIDSLKHELEYKGGTVGIGNQYFKDDKVLCVAEYENHGSHSKLFTGGLWYRTSNGAKAVPVGGQGSEDTATMFHHGPFFAMRLRERMDQLSVVPPSGYAESEFSKCVCLRTKEIEGSHLKRYFDRESGLMTAIQRWHLNEGAANPIMRLQSKLEYEEVEGVMVVCRSIRSNDSGWKTECLFTNFEFHVEIDDQIFELGQIEPDDD